MWLFPFGAMTVTRNQPAPSGSIWCVFMAKFPAGRVTATLHRWPDAGAHSHAVSCITSGLSRRLCIGSLETLVPSALTARSSPPSDSSRNPSQSPPVLPQP
jgi:hypothetical protein